MRIAAALGGRHHSRRPNGSVGAGSRNRRSSASKTSRGTLRVVLWMRPPATSCDAASDMLSDLAAAESSVALARRLRRYDQPRLLCIDEVAYLSYADLLYEVVTRRYDGPRSIVLSTNKPFAEWSEVFPHAACTVTLIDRLLARLPSPTLAPETRQLAGAQAHAQDRRLGLYLWRAPHVIAFDHCCRLS
jgi:hypothetical protein